MLLLSIACIELAVATPGDRGISPDLNVQFLSGELKFNSRPLIVQKTVDNNDTNYDDDQINLCPYCVYYSGRSILKTGRLVHITLVQIA